MKESEIKSLSISKLIEHIFICFNELEKFVGHNRYEDRYENEQINVYNDMHDNLSYLKEIM